MGFVTGFRGLRDGFQVPIALAEAGMLDGFVTDLYVGWPERVLGRALPARRAEQLLARHDGRLDGQPVLPMRGLALREKLATLGGIAPDELYARFDPAYGHAMARAARRHRSDLLCYSAYAPSAFSAEYDHRPRKILFQYHPHYVLEDRILVEDAHAAEQGGQAINTAKPVSGFATHRSRLASDDAWRLADHIVCASSFTRRSLVEAGADADRISVISYGVELPTPIKIVRPGHFQALFVGSGFRRKGLHHLLAAWRAADLAPGSTLTVVARVIEPDLLEMVRQTPATEYRAGVSSAELATLYATASLFVMPSLVEGFGQVYLEALASGLPVLGTPNTALPDLGSEEDGVFIVPAGNPTALAEMLGRQSHLIDADPAIRIAARATAARFDWAKFRTGVAEIASNAG
ncbi:glycosyltransferase family 4 protein [Phenylobacterium sp.]|uniref:glycosyltransferase family 4 protein n=1 Tax=Phenylobacterium sp. TaxID=1871053 RepID=UPI002737C33C|nr:glycosyltransferase family 4 protein [Phenylobacterium sp.]MDP3868369.1 glycosyltransferase family 4 protein [Phenylobacterium sp.]